MLWFNEAKDHGYIRTEEDERLLVAGDGLAEGEQPEGRCAQKPVTFEIDANGIVGVSAKDLGTGKAQSVRITAQSGLNEDEIQKIITAAASNEAHDELKKQLAELRNSAEGLIYTTEKSLEEYASLLKSQDVDEIKSDLQNLKDTLDSAEPAKLKEALQRLEGSAYRIADAIYAAEQK